MESKMIEAIVNRRSIRFYKEDVVSDQDIARCSKPAFARRRRTARPRGTWL